MFLQLRLQRRRSELEQRRGAVLSVDLASRELERARETWDADRARLTQDFAAERSRAERAFIAVTELESLRDHKAALETSRSVLKAALEELRRDVDERIRQAEAVSPFPACASSGDTYAHSKKYSAPGFCPGSISAVAACNRRPIVAGAGGLLKNGYA